MKKKLVNFHSFDRNFPPKIPKLLNFSRICFNFRWLHHLQCSTATCQMESTSPQTSSHRATPTRVCWSKSKAVSRFLHFLNNFLNTFLNFQEFHYAKWNRKQHACKVGKTRVIWWKRSEMVRNFSKSPFFWSNFSQISSRHKTPKSWATSRRYSPAEAVKSPRRSVNSCTTCRHWTYRLGKRQRRQWRRVDGAERNIRLIQWETRKGEDWRKEEIVFAVSR